MKIIISPAKTLDLETPVPVSEYTIPKFQSQARKIHAALKDFSPAELSQLLDISPKLAELNWQRNQVRTYQGKTYQERSRQAVYMFNGEVYLGIDIQTLSEEKVHFLQDRLRILSGMYGLLKPLDLIQPYRLEMGIHLPVGEARNLYEFWRESVTKELNKELKKGDFLVNLASHEYFSAIDTKRLKAPVIHVEFKDYRNGKLATLAFFAKKGRGLMVRHIAETNAETVDDLKNFDREGYHFDEKLSDEHHLVFTR